MSTPEKRVRTTRPRGIARRAQILEAAQMLFSDNGFHNVGIAQIAEAVGITQAGLLHHFPTKAALLLAVLEQREERAQEEGLGRRTGTDYVDGYVAVLGRHEQNPEIVQLFTVLSAEAIAENHPAHDWFTERYRTLAASVMRALKGKVRLEELPAGVDEETFARWLVALSDGLRLQALLNPGSVDRAESLRMFAELYKRFLIDDSSDKTSGTR